MDTRFRYHIWTDALGAPIAASVAYYSDWPVKDSELVLSHRDTVDNDAHKVLEILAAEALDRWGAVLPLFR